MGASLELVLPKSDMGPGHMLGRDLGSAGPLWQSKSIAHRLRILGLIGAAENGGRGGEGVSGDNNSGGVSLRRGGKYVAVIVEWEERKRKRACPYVQRKGGM